MAGNTGPSRRPRVIALLPGGSTALTAGGFFRLIRVGSGYEAAAELLGGPASALLVDLSMLTERHGALLKLAGGLDVPVVAFGTVSSAIDGTALAGVRLVGAEQADEVLRSLVKKGSGAFFSLKATVPPRCNAAKEKKAPDPFFMPEELDALLSD